MNNAENIYEDFLNSGCIDPQALGMSQPFVSTALTRALVHIQDDNPDIDMMISDYSFGSNICERKVSKN